MDLRELQRPLKGAYKSDPSKAKITLEARASVSDTPLACSVDIGRALYESQAHAGVGGAGTGACSGDLLLGSLAACAQVTCQMIAAAMGISVHGVEVSVEGELDLRGTLGMSKDVPVGFEHIRVTFNIDAPDATPDQLDALKDKTERYCVVYQTLVRPPAISATWNAQDGQVTERV